jgi:hypothetical protein
MFMSVMCSIPFCFVVVVVVVVVVIMCIYSLHYECTSYALVMCWGMSQWCGNDNHVVPQHVTRNVKR